VSGTSKLKGLTYPNTDGTNGQFIKTDGSGNLSFASAGTGDVTTTGTQVLTNKTIHGDANTLTVDGTNFVGFKKLPAVGTKTSSYTLATGDVGKYVQVGASGSITIPDATFAEGDAISIFNNTSSGITITCSITTAYIAGTDSDKATMTLATRGVATILFISGTVCVVSGNVI
jgi:Flp pilus assembly protein TadG